MQEIRVALIGIGNCASALVQGVCFYSGVKTDDEPVPGLMHNLLAGYSVSDIKFVAAFDVDRRKVGRDLSEAIFAKPNCTTVFHRAVPKQSVVVHKGPVLDGIAPHMAEYPEDRTFSVDEGQKAVDIVRELRRSGADMVVNYLPVGSEEATRVYAAAALEAGAAFVNCVPVFIASDVHWAGRFAARGLPVVGDDVKGQVGATIVHRVLAQLFAERGVKITGTYQLNVGGNTDFLNMLARDRGTSKKVSKTEAVQSQLRRPLGWDRILIGPSDYVPWLNDHKVCFMRIEGEKFGGVPVNVELRLSVEDSPNSAACVIDAIRAAKVALNRKVAGALISVPAYLMKHPPEQFPDNVARQMAEEFIRGERDR